MYWISSGANRRPQRLAAWRRRAVDRRLGEMKAVRAGAVAFDLGQGLDAASVGGPLGFEDQDPSAFTERQAVAVLAERPAGFGRVIVSLRERPQRAPGATTAGEKGLSAPPVTAISSIPVRIRLKGLPNRVRRRSAQAASTATRGPWKPK